MRPTNTRVDPEQSLILDALKQFSKVPSSACTSAIGSQIRSKYLDHGIATLRIWSSTGLGVSVSTAGLLISGKILFKTFNFIN